MNRIIRILAALMIVPCALLIAGTTGKIAGRITDAATGEGLAGVNILVVGTPLGAATDVDGHYAIINVPPGRYDVRVRLVGYTPVTYQNVRVTADQTTAQDVKLEASAVELADIVVQAQRPMVQKDLTATMSVVSSEQIDLLPVRNFMEVLQLQAGVVGDGNRLYVRGGRSNEVSYLIDGMYVKDPVLGTLGTRINNDAIAEMNFLSGTFNAEYGNALSGVVNIVTKDGTRDYTGSLEARTSEFGAREFTDMHEDRVSMTLSGPIGGEDATFFVTGERDATGSWLPFGYDRTVSGLAKVGVRVLPQIKLSGSGRYTQNERQPYNHTYKYIPDQYIRIREYSRQGTLTLTHTVEQNLFYDLRLSYFNQSYYSGLDKELSEYLTTALWDFHSAGNGQEFYSKATPVEITRNNTETFNVRGDLVWQLGKVNEVKFGAEVKKHNLWYYDIYDPARDHPYLTDFAKNPLEGAGYLQDKIELNALVINLGLRYDYANQLTSFRNNPLDPASLMTSKPKSQLSPRLGVAHPVSDRTTLHFSYGRFFQNPDYSRLYENSQYDIAVREPLFGQPDLDAERTTAYEVGLSQQFGDFITGNFTAYYKDITGLIGTRYLAPYVDGRFIGYTLYVNDAYANVRGFEVNLTMRRMGYVSGSLAYTYSVARGSASSETEDYPGTTTSTLLFPLSWDKPHSLSLNVSVYFPDGDGPGMFGATPLENMYWNFVLRAGSGLPYTPGGRRLGLGFIEKNSARMPATYSLDAEISKDWKIAPVTLTAFVEVLNLTNHKNVVYVYSDTGSPDVTLEGGHSVDYMQDPSNYGAPRRIRIGARLQLF
jgi:outer membrane receptor protein involved in Fe transport